MTKYIIGLLVVGIENAEAIAQLVRIIVVMNGG